MTQHTQATIMAFLISLLLAVRASRGPAVLCRGSPVVRLSAAAASGSEPDRSERQCGGVVLLLSGGVESATLLFEQATAGEHRRIHPLFFDYRQV